MRPADSISGFESCDSGVIFGRNLLAPDSHRLRLAEASDFFLLSPSWSLLSFLLITKITIHRDIISRTCGLVKSFFIFPVPSLSLLASLPAGNEDTRDDNKY